MMLNLKIFEGIDGPGQAALLDDYFGRYGYDEGTTLVEKGHHGNVMFIVLEGDVKVRITGTQSVTIPVGEVFGEICLIDSGLRTASVFAGKDCILATINRHAFDFLQTEKPVEGRILMQNIMKLLVSRIRRDDDTIREIDRELSRAKRPSKLVDRLRAMVYPS